jgi:hypothetical protein
LITEQMTQALTIQAAVNPQVIVSQYVNSGVVDMSKSRRALFILEIGSVTGGGSITASLQESASSGSGFAANGTAGAFSNSSGLNTQLTGLTTSNKQYTFEVNAEQLTNGKQYVRLNVGEVGGQNVYVSVVALGGEGIHKPNSANNDSSVVTQEVVA